jgi:integrase
LQQSIRPNITLREPLCLPVEVIEIDGLPKVLAGHLPVTPLNVALQRRRDIHGATPASLECYTRAARLHAEFAAHHGRALIDVTNEEFRWFVRALTGNPFPNASGQQKHLSGSRGPRTADMMITLLYSLAADIEGVYGVRFDWRRYRGASIDLVDLLRAVGGRSKAKPFPREHRVPYTPKQVLPLPDDQFELLLMGAQRKWGDHIAEGDAAFADDPEAQRGALFHRNVGLLLALRFEGARRSEPSFITLEDVNREQSRLYLVTKGHGGATGKKLPVLLHPYVDAAIWTYATKYRPLTDENSVIGYPVFVSHSTCNYGQWISAQCVRKVIDALREFLTPPWNKRVSPHTLRHRYAVDLQKYAGEAGTVVNMRHASYRSLDAYRGSIEDFAPELIATANRKLTAILTEFGLTTLDPSK